MSTPNETTQDDATSTAVAALIAATVPVSGARGGSDAPGKGRASRSLSDVAMATRAVSGWYERAMGYEDRPSTVLSGQAATLDDIVRRHVAVRKEWEHREAISLASWLTHTLAHAAPSRVAKAMPAVVEAPVNTARRALLIDDSSDILVTVGAFLEAFGFVVTVASGSDAALEVLSKTPVDLLVTDHAMPGMTGKDLVTEALQQNPALRAMIITGYPNLEELKTLPPNVMVLAKPFRRAELFNRLRALFVRRDDSDTTVAFAAELCAPSR